MGHPAVDDMRLLHPTCECIETARDFRDHAPLHRVTLHQFFCFLRLQDGDGLEVLIEDPGYIGEKDEFLRAECLRDAPAAVSAFTL